MKLFSAILISLVMCSMCFAEDISKVSLPLEVKEEMKISGDDPSIQGKQWNRWESENFVVCALNDTQTQYLHEHLELVKAWALTRWGLGDAPFTAECRLLCVDDAAMFEKLFGLKKSTAEIRRSADGKIKLSIIYLLTDNKPSRVVPVPLTEVCISEFNQRWSEYWGWWAYRGMSILNGSIDQIKSNLINLNDDIKENRTVYFGKSLFEMTREQYLALPADKQEAFDRSSVVLCLMVRKEFGQEKSLRLLKKTANRSDPELALQELYRFKNYADFDLTFKKYMADLCHDIAIGKTPVSYLQIKEK